MYLLLFIRLDRSIDHGHANVIELFHSLLDLVLAGIDISHEHVVVFYLLRGRLSGQGNLMMLQRSSL